jgi:hypothetical protein
MPLLASALHFENAAGQVSTHPAGYVLLTYKPGPRTLPDLQALITRIGLLLLRNGWHRILGDQRLMAPLSLEENAWLVEFWQAYTQQRPGRIYVAVVHPQDVFARLAVSQLRQNIGVADLAYRSFADEASAIAWLAKH